MVPKQHPAGGSAQRKIALQALDQDQTSGRVARPAPQQLGDGPTILDHGSALDHSCHEDPLRKVCGSLPVRFKVEVGAGDASCIAEHHASMA
jgi:hypothetical protein